MIAFSSGLGFRVLVQNALQVIRLGVLGVFEARYVDDTSAFR